MWTKDSLHSLLEGFEDNTYNWTCLENTPLGCYKKSAVLVPLVIKYGNIYVWLTQRSSNLRHDAGQVAFPGGIKEPEDKDEASTALRETQEEIGLSQDQCEVLCRLIPRINPRKILITPVVGLVSECFSPVPNAEEVSDTFLLPLERFLSRRDQSVQTFSDKGLTFTLPYFRDMIGEKLVKTWGMTAVLCMDLAVTVFRREPEFEWDSRGVNSVQNPYALQELYLKRHLDPKEISKM